MAVSASDLSAPDLSASLQSAQPEAEVGNSGVPDTGGGLDPAIEALCAPISQSDPCGPDLDFDGDPDYLNFIAQAEVVLPTSFFSPENGRPFDRTTIDIQGQLGTLQRLMARTRDLRLLILQARLHILDRNLVGFARSVAAIAHLLERYWDTFHPRPEGGDIGMRSAAISALDMPTVIFPLQYAPLFEARRVGAITYRGLMVAMDEVPPRLGESKLEVGPIMEAVSTADAAVLTPARNSVSMLKSSLDTIKTAFMVNGQSAGLKSLPELVGKILAFIDPHALAAEGEGADEDLADAAETAGEGPSAAGRAPSSLAEASAALAAIADYYSRMEPSSPTLPLVRQAHQLIGRSFFEIISILVPSQMEYAAFRIGHDQVFDLPIGKLSDLSEVAPVRPTDGSDGPDEAASYRVETRSQAIALLDLVQRFFRKSEPSSPVPMLCERARALAERDFMSVLRDVLPKSALRNPHDEN
jgi:type VI secretion system protein ImpA